MPKKNFIIGFIALPLSFIFLQIHKQSYLVKFFYEKQKNEKLKQELIEKKNKLNQEWCMAQNKSTIKKYAQEKLGMKRVALHQIKKFVA